MHHCMVCDSELVHCGHHLVDCASAPVIKSTVGCNHVEGHVQNYPHIRPQTALQSLQRSRRGALHGSTKVCSRGVQGASTNQCHHHKRWRGHQPLTDSWERVPEARLGAAPDPKGPRGQQPAMSAAGDMFVHSWLLAAAAAGLP